MIVSPITTSFCPVAVSTYEGVSHSGDPEETKLWSWPLPHPHPLDEGVSTLRGHQA